MSRIARVACVGVAVAVVACGGKPATPPVATPVAPLAPVAREPARRDFAVPTPPVTLAIAGKMLVWTDIAGAIYAMASDGREPPRELSNQHAPAFAFRVVTVGDRVLASSKRDFLEVALPAGPVTPLGLALDETPEQVVATDTGIFVTLFQRDVALRVDPARRRPEHLADVARGVLATHGGWLYIASYATGRIVMLPAAGGAPTTIARGFDRPTALAADDSFAFVYTERDRSIHRVAVADGATSVIARGLTNADRLVVDGDWVYTFDKTRRARLVRIAKAGGTMQVLADDLAAPHALVVTADAIWVTSRDQNKIVRFAKAALAP